MYLTGNQQIKVLIPTGIKPGDTFIHTLDDGRVINVMVPDDSYYRPGQFMEIFIAEEMKNVNDNNIVIPKSTAGAALAGFVIGSVLLGPIGGAIVASSAAYCTTREEGKVGVAMRHIGDITFSKATIAKDWMEKEIQVLSKKIINNNNNNNNTTDNTTDDNINSN